MVKRTVTILPPKVVATVRPQRPPLVKLIIPTNTPPSVAMFILEDKINEIIEVLNKID